MSDSFNPYAEWLGIHHQVTSYYQMIGLPEFEADVDKIRLASERAITRVRSYRPGQYATQWAQLLDLLKRIKSELTDPQANSPANPKADSGGSDRISNATTRSCAGACGGRRRYRNRG